jgi:hypothetical protein
MRVYFQPFRGGVALRQVLQADGWLLEGGDDAFLAGHPGVTDEPTARSRLYRLGLLTSSGLRIEFVRAVGRNATARP